MSKPLDDYTAADSPAFDDEIHRGAEGYWKPIYPSEVGRALKHVEADYNYKVLTGTLANYRIYPSSMPAGTTGAQVENFTGDEGKILTLRKDPSEGWYWTLATDNSGKWLDGVNPGDIYYDGGDVGIGTNDPSEALEVIGKIEVSEEFIGDLRGAIRFNAQAGEALQKCDVVYISGINGNKVVVSKADASDPSKMPAFGCAFNAANNGANLEVVTFGTLQGHDTQTPGWNLGDTLYVSATTPGALTNVKPAGESNLIQNIAKVQRIDLNGSIKIGGAGRTNDTPNLNEGSIFLGNSSNYQSTLPIGNENTVLTSNGTTALWQQPPFSVFKQVCTPIANAATGGDAMPNNSGGVNWFYQNSSMNKWVFTANNPVVKSEFLAGGSSVNVEVVIGAATDVGNDIEWSLRLYQPGTGNYYQVAASSGEPGPNNAGMTLQSNGPTFNGSNFTACVVQTRIATIDMKSNFFDLYGNVGELELWIRNAGFAGSIISSCGATFYS